MGGEKKGLLSARTGLAIHRAAKVKEERNWSTRVAARKEKKCCKKVVHKREGRASEKP